MAAVSENGKHTDGAYELARQHFAYFESERGNPIFMENAGGSQVPHMVAQGVSEHLLYNNAQLGAGYSVSSRADQTIQAAHDFVKTFVNAQDSGEVILGASTSQLMQTLADAYRRSGSVTAEDEIIVHEACHESNAGPWVRLAKDTGAKLTFWKVQTSAPYTSTLKDLKTILSPRTKIVAIVHVSNVLGEVNDLPDIQAAVREAGNAHLVVDGVAYAPHLPIDVSVWGVDWYVFSTYKTWGPHMGALYGRHGVLDTVKSGGPNHYFVPEDDVVYKFELGSASHEGCGGLAALGQYFQLIAGEKPQAGKLTRGALEAAYRKFLELELPLQQKLLQYLDSKPQITIVGPSHAKAGERVSTISFVVEGRKSAEIASQLHRHNIACRNGHMYAHRLLTALAKTDETWDVQDGVVRISMLHYNTPAEVDHLLAALDEILGVEE